MHTSNKCYQVVCSIYIWLTFASVVGIDASTQSSGTTNYWAFVWPNTTLPTAFSDLLLPDGRTNGLPLSADELNLYMTIFLEHDLYPGKKMTLDGYENFQPTLGVMDSIKQKEEEEILAEFCQIPFITGEQTKCVDSLESMINYVVTKFGTANVKAISSTLIQNQYQYVVEKAKRVGENAIDCHRLNFKKVVFNCRQQTSAVITYMVSLVTPDGTKAKALAICLRHTSGMGHLVTISKCHFIGNNAATVWVPSHSYDD